MHSLSITGLQLLQLAQPEEAVGLLHTCQLLGPRRLLPAKGEVTEAFFSLLPGAAQVLFQHFVVLLQYSFTTSVALLQLVQKKQVLSSGSSAVLLHSACF